MATTQDRNIFGETQPSPTDGELPVLMEEPLPANAAIDTLASTTLQSGRTVTIEKFTIVPPENSPEVDSANQTEEKTASLFGYRAVISAGEDSEAQSYLLTSDTHITEDENGVLRISSYTVGEETDGDDIIIGFHGRALSGGAGNDTIVELSADYEQSKAEQAVPASGFSESGDIAAGKADSTANMDSGPTGISSADRAVISGGDGDDTVIFAGQRVLSVSVSTGSGNDTIISSGDLEVSSIDTGDGDDDLRVRGNLHVRNGTIDTGSGDDNIQVMGDLHAESGIIRTGDGDDIIGTGGSIVMHGKGSFFTQNTEDTVLDTGSGNDIIHAEKTIELEYSSIRSGSGDDQIYACDIHADREGIIDSGSGNDHIDASDIMRLKYGSAIISGDGDDTVRAGRTLSMYWESAIMTGDGDDSITSGKNMTVDVYSLVKTGDGDDVMRAENRLHVDGDSIVATGSGDDSISGGREFSIDGNSLVYTGDGDDSIGSGRRMHSDGNSVVNTGSGNDSISAGKQLTTDGYARIHTGNGDDVIRTDYSAGAAPGGAAVSGNGYMSGLSLSGGSAITTGSGDDIITSERITISNGSSIRTGSGDDIVSTAKLSVGGVLDTGSGDDRINAAEIFSWGGGNRLNNELLSYFLENNWIGSGNDVIGREQGNFTFIDTAGQGFKGLDVYRNLLRMEDTDPDYLVEMRENILQKHLRGNIYTDETVSED